MSNRLVLLLLLCLSVSCSSKQRQRVFSIRNGNASSCHIPYVADDPSDFLRVGRRKSLLITDANGFTVPYQRLDSGKVIFMLDIPGAQSKKYTFQATKLHADFPSGVKMTRKSNGDVIWGNSAVSFMMRSSSTQGQGGGIGYIPDSMSKNVPLRNTLGFGGLALYCRDGSLVRSGNFTSMELLDSGPVLIRMKFIFPEVEYEGKTLHEERTVSIVPSVRFSKIESRFVGAGKFSVAVGMPYTDAQGHYVASQDEANPRFSPSVQTGKGYMCYAQEGVSENHGTIFSAVLVERKNRCRLGSADGHMVLIADLGEGESFVYYQGAASSYTGMNYQMWVSHSDAFAAHVRSSMMVKSYDVK